MLRIAPVLALILLAGCMPRETGPLSSNGPPPDPKVISGITTACTDSGLFKLADGALTIAVPAAALPVAVINAGVDRVCADPARFAGDISTIEWVAKNLATAHKKAA